MRTEQNLDSQGGANTIAAPIAFEIVGSSAALSLGGLAAVGGSLILGLGLAMLLSTQQHEAEVRTQFAKPLKTGSRLEQAPKKTG
ncbi:MAG: hypothetical protein IPJ88_15465 [Myxococcales bacterium]|nr:MAG: hypothetical protein IPJ88_15465 [Myxococcales bacterium]